MAKDYYFPSIAEDMRRLLMSRYDFNVSHLREIKFMLNFHRTDLGVGATMEASVVLISPPLIDHYEHLDRPPFVLCYTLLHECAHILNDEYQRNEKHGRWVDLDGHGPEWQEICHKIGIAPYRMVEQYRPETAFTSELRQILERMYPDDLAR